MSVMHCVYMPLAFLVDICPTWKHLGIAETEFLWVRCALLRHQQSHSSE